MTDQHMTTPGQGGSNDGNARPFHGGQCACDDCRSHCLVVCITTDPETGRGFWCSTCPNYRADANDGSSSALNV